MFLPEAGKFKDGEKHDKGIYFNDNMRYECEFKYGGTHGE